MMKKIALVVSALCLVLVLYLSSLFFFAYNPVFYAWQYEQHGNYARLGYDQQWAATHQLWDYMLFNSDELTYFSSRDALHMVDVRNILCSLEYVLFFSALVVLLVLLYYSRTMNKKEFFSFIHALFRLTFWVSCVVLALGALAALFFDSAFLLFHLVSFSNTYWLLDPGRDVLVILFPQQFFQTIFICIVITGFLLSLGLFFFGRMVKKQCI